MRMTAKQKIEALIVKFNDKVAEDEVLQKELEGLKKTVQVDLGEEQYNFTLQDKKIDCFCEGKLDNPDITITSDPETIEGLIDGNIRPMKAFALRKIRVNGSLEDILHLRKLFETNTKVY